MTGTFYTDRQEAKSWFALETRPLPMPGGSLMFHTDCRMTWRSFDFLIAEGVFDAQRLVELTMLGVEEQGGSFDRHFPFVLAYIHDEYLKSLEN